MFYWIQTLALSFCSGSKQHLVRLKNSYPSMNQHRERDITNKAYGESEMRTRQKRIVTPGEPQPYSSEHSYFLEFSKASPSLICISVFFLFSNKFLSNSVDIFLIKYKGILQFQKVSFV